MIAVRIIAVIGLVLLLQSWGNEPWFPYSTFVGFLMMFGSLIAVIILRLERLPRVNIAKSQSRVSPPILVIIVATLYLTLVQFATDPNEFLGGFVETIFGFLLLLGGIIWAIFKK
jgi:hypothetical protein